MTGLPQNLRKPQEALLIIQESQSPGGRHLQFGIKIITRNLIISGRITTQQFSNITQLSLEAQQISLIAAAQTQPVSIQRYYQFRVQNL
ncbi:hypothetical protein FGO68_gene4397 [Halteria grandinella]|uniref:Uncharacterized protein n=1 Tax=Halteria grandinella TaxID=5974 RepID=A0A8J8NCZ4_HALGN|nr:hypothetical protein FGO68_gene4397 [Halteria grandinella]